MTAKAVFTPWVQSKDGPSTANAEAPPSRNAPIPASGPRVIERMMWLMIIAAETSDLSGLTISPFRGRSHLDLCQIGLSEISRAMSCRNPRVFAGFSEAKVPCKILRD
jgi:hypothetical protein